MPPRVPRRVHRIDTQLGAPMAALAAEAAGEVDQDGISAVLVREDHKVERGAALAAVVAAGRGDSLPSAKIRPILGGACVQHKSLSDVLERFAGRKFAERSFVVECPIPGSVLREIMAMQPWCQGRLGSDAFVTSSRVYRAPDGLQRDILRVFAAEQNAQAFALAFDLPYRPK